MRVSYKISLACVLLLILYFFFAALALCGEFDPARAVVRITSHGASGTVIRSDEKKTYILSCAHMLSPKTIRRRLVIDGPVQDKAPRAEAEARLLKWDRDLDLSLIELATGPFYACPVAPRGYAPGDDLVSLGYDEMKWPVTYKKATIVGVVPRVIFTKERPWHGRSGGGLIDRRTNYLIGVVQAYEVDPLTRQVTPNCRGMYVGHDAILSFLDPANGPQIYRPVFPQECPGGLCPQ